MSANTQLLVILAVVVGLWLAFVYATGRIAGDRGHSPAAWYPAAILFGPVAMIAALVSPFTPELVARAIAASAPSQVRGRAASAHPRHSVAGSAGASAPDGLDPGGWEVAYSTDPRVPAGEVVYLGRELRLLLVRGEAVEADLDIDSLRASDSGGLLAITGDHNLRLSLRPLDGQTPAATATSFGLL